MFSSNAIFQRPVFFFFFSKVAIECQVSLNLEPPVKKTPQGFLFDYAYLGRLFFDSWNILVQFKSGWWLVGVVASASGLTHHPPGDFAPGV